MSGYEKLSRLIGVYPELAIYRKFSTLCAKMLLYKQAELQHLENELDIISQIDSCNSEKSVFAVSWRAIDKGLMEGGDNLQKQKISEINEKINEYYSALLKARQVHTLAKPGDSDINFLREWLERPDGGDYSIKGVEAEPWKLCRAADLVTLSQSDGRDVFAQSLSDNILPWYHRYFGHRQKGATKSNDGLDNIWEYQVCSLNHPVLPQGPPTDSAT
ncbi:hypothetical protein EPUS_01176 [Endocarpon pusillum Z07020]|uniref:DUF6594 domain-containing protein n=1 Tax=Endocarpon pusillum (strain Z07020 / HMAS-L-300199) TaxID=1263415 RepID=U1HJW5_ENDPU|nr:uncharacterized protein EPUS_01176 [Endocarpon pusillum Z07020]ERF69219.1 hypothetical protein EPUS_01176 [Endocarpon pusillum Z07020]